jgi:hypothetical protein
LPTPDKKAGDKMINNKFDTKTADLIIVNYNEKIVINGIECKECKSYFSDGNGEYSDVIYVKFCNNHKIK